MSINSRPLKRKSTYKLPVLQRKEIGVLREGEREVQHVCDCLIYEYVEFNGVESIFRSWSNWKASRRNSFGSSSEEAKAYLNKQFVLIYNNPNRSRSNRFSRFKSTMLKTIHECILVSFRFNSINSSIVSRCPSFVSSISFRSIQYHKPQSTICWHDRLWINILNILFNYTSTIILQVHQACRAMRHHTDTPWAFPLLCLCLL